MALTQQQLSLSNSKHDNVCNLLEMNKINIWIQIFGTKISLNIHPTITIRQIKEIICSKTKILPKQQKIWINDNLLTNTNNETVKNCFIQEGTILKVCSLDDSECDESEYDESEYDEIKSDELNSDELNSDELKFDELKSDEFKFDKSEHDNSDLDKINIWIQIFDAKISLNVRSTNTIQQIKEIIYSKTKILPEKQKIWINDDLSFLRNDLDNNVNNDTAEKCGIKQETVLRVCSSDEAQIFIIVLENEKRKTLTISADLNKTIEQLKQQIFEIIGISIHEQILLFDNATMEDVRTLGDYANTLWSFKYGGKAIKIIVMNKHACMNGSEFGMVYVNYYANEESIIRIIDIPAQIGGFDINLRTFSALVEQKIDCQTFDNDLIVVNSLRSLSTVDKQKIDCQMSDNALIFGGKILHHERPLKKYGVWFGCTLYMAKHYEDNSKTRLSSDFKKQTMESFHDDVLEEIFYVFIKDIFGKTQVVYVTSSYTILRVKKILEGLTNIHVQSQRLVFAGKQLWDDYPFSDIPKEAHIHLVLPLRGGCIAAPNPSKFINLSFNVNHEDNHKVNHEVNHEIKNIVNQIFKSNVFSNGIVLLTNSECAILTNYLDIIYNNDNDFIKSLNINELNNLIGTHAVQRLIEHFDGPFDTIKLRRVVATGKCIKFHTDFAWRTMQIPLNDESEYVGGKVIYKIDQELIAMKRVIGTACIHTHEVLHGVEPLISGIRYSLFLCETNARMKDNEFDDLVDLVLEKLIFYQTINVSTNDDLIKSCEHYIKTFNSINISRLPNSELEFVRHSHMLLPTSNSSNCNLALSELVLIVERNKIFMDSISESHIQRHEIVHAISEYREFMKQMRSNQLLNPPNKLVDLVWHTHMQFPERYIADCKRIIGFVVDHIIES